MSLGRILIIDDDSEIRRALRVALVANGFEVLESRSGEEALEKSLIPAPDLLLLDLQLPGMGGLEICRAIRAISDVPIIVISVKHAQNSKIDLLDAGADDYLVKPFGIEELLARVRANLRRTSAAAALPSVLVLGAVEIDLRKRLIRKGRQDIRLKPKEFELLQYLILHAGDVIPHRRLLQAVWGPEYGNEFQYLRVIVNRLRRKIEVDPAHPKYIITEPKVGYSFVSTEHA